MNRKQFLDELEKNLHGLPKEDIAEILDDYKEHFKVGRKKNRKESEIAESLGDPKEIAKEAKEELSDYTNKISIGTAFLGLWEETKKITKKVWKNFKNEISQARVKEKKETKEKPKEKKRKKKAWKTILLLSLNIFIMFWIMIAFYITVFSLVVSGISIIISGVATTIFSLFVLMNPTDHLLRNISLAGVFSGIGVLALGILWSLLSLKLGKGLSWLVKKYMKATNRWTKK
jgi:uncharacterized membrane protein